MKKYFSFRGFGYFIQRRKVKKYPVNFQLHNFLTFTKRYFVSKNEVHVSVSIDPCLVPGARVWTRYGVVTVLPQP